MLHLALLATLSWWPAGAVSQEAPSQEPARAHTPGLTLHRAPKPLAEHAVVEAWPSFLGPRRNGLSQEAPLASDFGAGGPPLVWSLERGEGLASPAVAEGRLVFTHRVGGQVHVDCHLPETGERLWRHSFPCDYGGRYYDNGGPRATPTIGQGRVIVHGAGGRLLCLDLATGALAWQLDTAVDMRVGDDYFGVVSTPLVVGDLVVQNVGAPGGPSVAAFELATGKLRWGAGRRWGPSCASPVLARIAGKERILVLAGGKSEPPTGGLMVLSPTGELTCELPFRSRTTLSVNGPSPVPVGDSVFLTAAYNLGSALVDIDAEGRGKERWRDHRSLALEFSTPILVDGSIIAIDGVAGRAGSIIAVDPATGAERARKSLEFEEVFGQGEAALALTTSVGKGSLLHADGVFWILGDTGQLVTARLVDGAFEVIAEALLFYARETWTPPVLSGGLLYVCQNYPEPRGGAPARLLCYDVRGAR
jgi:outer membrane protein assembly factor BamB